MKMALAMICRGTAEEAKHLKVCLEYAHDSVDAIYITLNAPPGEEIHPDCYKVCKKYGAIVSEYVWQDDFAAARNYNFSQVPKSFQYILWLDADDALREGERLHHIVENNDKDAYSMWYQYDHDEHKRPYIVHQKVRIIRNDDSFHWVGRIHEDIMAKRDVSVHLITGTDVLHLSTQQHFEQNKARNLRIAQKAAQDLPDDPRSFWNLGNAYHGNEMYEEALKQFAVFLATTQSDEEKYIAYIRVAEENWNIGRRFEAIDNLRYAIGLKPTYPDAYTKMGSMLVSLKRYKDAILYLGQALKFPPPEYTIIVFNPRAYDYEPIRLLALAHYEVNEIDDALKYFELCLQIYPKDKELSSVVDKIRQAVTQNKALQEKADLLAQLNDDDLRKELEKLPVEERSHPTITHLSNTRFVRTESTGRDVSIFCGYTAHEWSPRIADETGVGGSEEAVIHLAKRWAEAGWNVTVYNSCGHQETRYQVTKGLDGKTGDMWVTYKPWWMWNYRDKQDVTILWRHPLMARYEINSPKIFIDMHDVIPDGEFTAQRLANITAVMFKSQAHADCYPNVPGDKARIVPNGIEPEDFQTPVAKEKGLIINTSSADRSLSTALEVFAEVKKRNPEARMEWAYGWEVFNNAHGDNKVMVEWRDKMKARMKELGVVERGRLNRHEVAELYERGHVFLYPTSFYEIFCISAVKAQLAGALPICSDFAALKEVVKWGIQVPSTVDGDTWSKPYQFDFAADLSQVGLYADHVVKMLEQEPTDCPMRDSLIKAYDWKRVATIWENIFKA